jgi:inositol phosphorylceramide synthase catalytic subunit
VCIARTLLLAPRRIATAGRSWLSEVATFGVYAAPFVATGVGYEVLRRVIHYRGAAHFAAVHVGDLYDLDARLFSLPASDGALSWTDFIAAHQHPILDVVCGAAYLLFLIEVFAIAAYLFFRARPKMLEISAGFFALNLVGWVIWLLYPAAPPWYVDQYGFGPVVQDAVSNPAGLLRLDALLGAPIAASFYAKSANVFGAMPSLHVAYVTLVACVTLPLGGKLRAFTLFFAGLIAFSAVYLRHHYVIDVVAGMVLAALVSMAMRWFVRVIVTQAESVPRAQPRPQPEVQA